jgi:RHS repeat-associated protein
MTYPDYEVVTTTYNEQLLPATLSSSVNSSIVISSTYNVAGQLTLLNFGNFVNTLYTYDPKNLRLTQLKTTGGIMDWQNIAYKYDNVGNIKTITDTAKVDLTEISNFGYDDLDRLTSAGITGGYSQGWAYNPIGNITQFAGANYSYGDASHKHAVTQVGTTAYSYDANGNMTSRGANTFQYDPENRLTQVVSGTVTTSYAYNGDGARVKQVAGSDTTYYVGNWFEVKNGVATKYYYFGAQRVAMKQGSTVTYLHGDHLGSTSVATNSGGAKISRQTYYAFGAVRTTEGTLPTDYTFTGQKRDDQSGLYFYNARYYDGVLGRFVQPDSVIPQIYDPQQLNRYSYARNNPLKYRDPTGHWFESALDIAFIALDIADIASNGLTWENGLSLAADVGGLILPGITGGGLLVRAIAHADDAVDAAKAVDHASDLVRAANRSDDAIDVYHATNAPDSVLKQIEKKFFDPKGDARFGKGFYTSADPATAVLEAENPSHIVRGKFDVKKADRWTLDLTDPEWAELYGYNRDKGATVIHREIADQARRDGAHVIKYESYANPGHTNYVFLSNWDDYLRLTDAFPNPY